MGKVFLICGKICSGKTFYARSLARKSSAVILSTDEATYDLTGNEQGVGYDAFARKVNLYLMKKASEIAAAGANVILDWGFWTEQGRGEITEYFKQNHIETEWHYIADPDALWRRNIEERNARCAAGEGGSDFYVDEGLLKKCVSLFEIPQKSGIDVWYIPQSND